MFLERRLLLEPTDNPWECHGVLNPTAIKKDRIVYLIYRALCINKKSSLGIAKIAAGNIEREDQPLVTREAPYEKDGVEDPRITRIDDIYYLLYTAYCEENEHIKNARVVLATSNNLKDFKKRGIISPNIPIQDVLDLINDDRYKQIWEEKHLSYKNNIIWDKDAVLFPEKIDGKYAILHRLEPDIQIAFFNEVEELQNGNVFWKDYIRNIKEFIVMKPKYEWEKEKIGAGPPPIKTEYGWLLLYHGVDKNRIYRAGAALLDLENPKKEFARLSKPLFEPEYPWEKKGEVDNVVFPEGRTFEDDFNTLNIYYGCADSYIGQAILSLKDLLKELKKKENRIKY